MQSVFRGNSIVLTATFEDGSALLTDPLNPRVTIRDPLGVAVITNGVPTRASVGVYSFTVPIANDATVGVWSADWTGTVAGQGLASTDYFEVLAAGSIITSATGTYSYDPTSPIGYIRLCIDDRDLTQVSLTLPFEQRSAIFTDEELGQFLVAVGNDTNYAIARALMTIANNRALMIQYRKIGKTEVNFGALRADLLKQAETWLALSDSIPAEAFAEVNYDDWSTRRIIINEQLREMR